MMKTYVVHVTVIKRTETIGYMVKLDAEDEETAKNMA